MKKQTIMLAAVLAAGMAAGCQAKEDTAGTQTEHAAVHQHMQPAGAVRKAVTPSGEVLYIIAVWDAAPETRHADHKPCRTAQCWKCKSGKIFCAKPLKQCHDSQKCQEKECFHTKDGKVMTTENDREKAASSAQKAWALKKVSPCPKNGSAACTMKEHVALPNGTKACSKMEKKQALVKAEAQDRTQPQVIENEIVEDGVFLVTVD